MPIWTIRCIYGEGALAKRDAALAAHEAYLIARSREIRFAGPMFAGDGDARSGLWLMIEAPDRAGAAAFIAEEAFNRAGMFGKIEIKRFVPEGPGQRRQVEIEPDPACEMFICEWVRPLEMSEMVAAAGESGQVPLTGRAMVAGVSVSDDGSRMIGATAIIEAADRARVEALVAAEPSVRSGRYGEIRIDRWRFGKSVV